MIFLDAYARTFLLMIRDFQISYNQDNALGVRLFLPGYNLSVPAQLCRKANLLSLLLEGRHLILTEGSKFPLLIPADQPYDTKQHDRDTHTSSLLVATFFRHDK